ncbi:hypothetical protein AGMMS49531_03240 [Endomicrobiia bacterium]|nr:hypothetical protein AGMMS49531_03240 [Endomicrobiia bacterium]
MKKAKTRRSRPCIKNVLAIIVMFACTSICFGDPDPIILDASSNVDITHGKAVAGNSNKPDGTANVESDGKAVAGNSNKPDGTANVESDGKAVAGNSDRPDGTANVESDGKAVAGNSDRPDGAANVESDGKAVAGNSDRPDGAANVESDVFPLDPNGCTLTVGDGAKVGEASGAWVGADSFFLSMTGNKIIVHGGNFSGQDINGACSLSRRNAVDVSGNTVKINAGEGIRNVRGGRTLNGTVSDNKVFIKNEVTIGGNVYGGHVFNNGNARDNKVTISSSTDSASSVSSTSPRVSAPAPSSSPLMTKGLKEMFLAVVFTVTEMQKGI